ncbi:TRAP transporter small permease [Lampropedia aestuarii]|uniref:TRAP transporter small permease n=1 Tax=Lampropedia aestuarii TaxID=2562762 RepID=UPI0024688925|nr:TRAP transporter small permease [Lampropedia aestuarii]MDH5858277.1 TRAP transporter small permease [Lampropedia aestuarii]
MQTPYPLTPPIWLQALARCDRWLYYAERAICVGALLLMLLATMVNVAIRNLQLNWPNYGELGLAALVPLTLIGAAMCTYLGSHIAIEIMQVVPSKTLRRIAELVVAIATIAFTGFYFYSGLVLIEEFRLTNDKLLDMGTPLWLLAVCFPIGMLLMCWHSLVRIVVVVFALCASEPVMEAAR